MQKGFYGADVSGPVFKRIAQKIFTDTPIIDSVETLEVNDVAVNAEYDAYFETAQTYKTIMPNVVGLPAMDAIALLENMGLNVKAEGVGQVKVQSISKGEKIKKNQVVTIQAS